MAKKVVVKTSGASASAQKQAAKNAQELEKLRQSYQREKNQATQDSANLYNQYAKEQQRLANQQNAATKAQYQNRQRSNYLNYMMNQKNLPEQLARLGVTGGASESAQLRANTNYENVRNATNTERDSTIANVNKALTDNLKSYKLTQNEQLAKDYRDIANNERTALQALKEKQAQDKKEKAQQNYDRYKDTIRRFDTIKKVDKAIKNAKAKGAPKWKIQLLQAQRADLVAAGAETGSSSSGGGSSRRSGGYSYSYSSGGSSSSNSSSSKAAKKTAKTKTTKKTTTKKTTSKRRGTAGDYISNWTKRKGIGYR